MTIPPAAHVRQSPPLMRKLLNRFNSAPRHVMRDESQTDAAIREPQVGERVSQARPGTARAPNFLVIGAGKCGTTSLWNALGQHPQVFMHPSKHLNYFAGYDAQEAFTGPAPQYQSHHVARTWDAYCAEFAVRAEQSAVGEACNTYLYSPDAAVRIRGSIPDARLIAVLRHPAERAFSRYLQLKRSGRESLEFAAALAAEDERIAARWWPDYHYLNAGLYHRQLSRFYDIFPAEQIKVHLFEDMQKRPEVMLRDIFAFLGVRDDFLPKMDVRYSASGLPKSKGVDWAFKKLRGARPLAQKLLREKQIDMLLRIAGQVHNRNLVKPKLSPEDRAWLIARYRDDVLKLQDLIKRDLTAWLS